MKPSPTPGIRCVSERHPYPLPVGAPSLLRGGWLPGRGQDGEALLGLEWTCCVSRCPLRWAASARAPGAFCGGPGLCFSQTSPLAPWFSWACLQTTAVVQGGRLDLLSVRIDKENVSSRLLSDRAPEGTVTCPRSKLHGLGHDLGQITEVLQSCQEAILSQMCELGDGYGLSSSCPPPSPTWAL